MSFLILKILTISKMLNCSFKYLITTVLLLLITDHSYSQIIDNMSLEGTPRVGSAPPEWNQCNQFSTPDILPGFWNVTKRASHGNTYAGIVTRGNLGPFANNHEDLQTRLLKPIQQGESYDFKIDLSYSDKWGHNIDNGSFLNYDTPAKLQVYGGSSSCSLTELLWESPIIDHTNWTTYSMTLNPKTINVTHLMLQAANTDNTFNFGNILIDNIVECFIEPNNEIVSDTTICEGIPLKLDFSILDGTYLWQDGTDSPTYTISIPGTYSVKVSNQCDSETYEINVKTRNCICDTAIPINVMAYDTVICQREPLIIDVSTPEGEYLWDDDSTNPLRTVSTAGTYAVEITNGCDTESFEYNVQTRNCVCDTAVPIAVTGYDTLICVGDEIIIDASTSGGIFMWDDGSSFPKRSVKEFGAYSVKITNGCDTENIEFNVGERECLCELSYPNVFTPNGDAMNDVFEVTASSEVSKYSLQIFQRTGDMVFQSDDPGNSWTGDFKVNELPSGVYFWQAKINCLINNEPIEKTYRGSVTLIR